MNNLNTQQMLELAKKVYPDYQWQMMDGRVRAFQRTNNLHCNWEFSPRLDGTDREQDQAHTVIAEALRRTKAPDLLTAASLALISGGRS